MTLTETFRKCVSEESENGFLIAADAFEESELERDRDIGQLLRTYCNIQTYVRMSQPIPTEMAELFKALNDKFGAEDRRPAADRYTSTYSGKLGPYFTILNTWMSDLSSDLEMLSAEPVRDLTVLHCMPGTNLSLILRNYRIDYMHRLTLRFDRNTRDTLSIAQAIGSLQGSQLNSLTILGVNDRVRSIQAMFMSNRYIRKGCDLMMSNTTYGTPERRAVKK